MDKPWNTANTAAMCDWLIQEKDSEDYKSRMDTLGNVVVPQQAFLGVSTLARMVRGDFFA